MDLPRIGAPATRALEAEGIRNLDGLVQRRRSEIAALHGVGPKALRILDAALGAAGLTWKEES